MRVINFNSPQQNRMKTETVFYAETETESIRSKFICKSEVNFSKQEKLNEN